MGHNNNNLNFNDTDTFFNDYQADAAYYNQPNTNYQPQQPHYNPSAQQQNGGYYDMQQQRSHSPNVYNPNGFNNNPNMMNQNYAQQPQANYNNMNNNSNQQFNANNMNYQQQQQKFAPNQHNQQSMPMGAPQPFFNPLQQNNLFNDPVASMAVKYGANLADQGKEYVAQNVRNIIWKKTNYSQSSQ